MNAQLARQQKESEARQQQQLDEQRTESAQGLSGLSSSFSRYELFIEEQRAQQERLKKIERIAIPESYEEEQK